MERTFSEAIRHRHSYYQLSDRSPVSDEKIREIVETVALHVPSAFNSQSTRMVLLLGENHKKLWQIVKDTLLARIGPERFPKTEEKINTSFASGYGTILFFEDQEVVTGMQKQFPGYQENFPVWSQHTSAMHQFSAWVMLEDAGFGASLQHYNPLIDDEVKATWNLPGEWQLVAQMPFGTPLGKPGEKEKLPIEKQVIVY